MARIRTIKPEFFKNEQVGSVAFEWRLLFAGLWTQADREGRLRERVRYLKTEIFPYDDIKIEVGLGSLEQAGLIVRYAVDGVDLIAIPTFLDHQRPTKKELASKLPPPPGRVQIQPEPSLDLRERSTGKEYGKGNGVPPEDASPTFLSFPVVGADGSVWALSEQQVGAFIELFPTIDVRQECRNGLAWVRANMGRRKTASGMVRFLTNWLTKAVDYRGGRGMTIPSAMSQPSPRWTCPHVEECDNQSKCRSATILGRPLKKAAS